MSSQLSLDPDPPLDEVLQRLERVGAVRVLAKRLSPNDNSKNQLYLGSGFSAIHVLPAGPVVSEPTRRELRLKAALDLAWMGADGGLWEAPGAQLILYPQYPEVRASGLLKGCKGAPSDLFASRLPGRVLLLGISNTGRIFAYLAAPGSAAAQAAEERWRSWSEIGALVEVGSPSSDLRAQLVAELRRIWHAGWIPSTRLDGLGDRIPCRAPNCGGLTLEAELGIRPNSYAAPDYLGWEVKQFKARRLDDWAVPEHVTLMTPEPTGGFYKSAGVEAFIREYGYADRAGRKDRLNFGGIHRVGHQHHLTGLTLCLAGYDPQREVIGEVGGGLELRDGGGQLAAGWDLSALVDHWRRKHARAVYVPSNRRARPPSYRFGSRIYLCEGPSLKLLLKAIHDGRVYYDPGIKLEQASSESPRVKRRSQWRTRGADLFSLYERVDRYDLDQR